jgi:hypothetical protein
VVKQPVNRKRILLFALPVLVILVLRETGPINLEYYHRNTKSTIHSDWQSSSITDTTDYNNEKAARERVITNNGSDRPISLKNMSVTAEYEGEQYSILLDTANILTVHLSTLNPGVIWTPLIKNTTFRATANISENITFQIAYNNFVISKLHTVSGTQIMNGHLSIVGFCSYREAKKIILQALLKQVAESVRAQLLNLDKY